MMGHEEHHKKSAKSALASLEAKNIPWAEGWMCLAIIYVVIPAVLASGGRPTANQLTTSVLVWLAQMIGVNCGFHRLFAHRSYKAAAPAEVMLALLGCLSGQGGPIWWSGIHRHHHQHCETELDFHSPHRSHGHLLLGLFWAHGLYLANYTVAEADKQDLCPDLTRKRWMRVLDHYCIAVFLGWAVACYWFGGMSGICYGWAVPTFVSWNCEQCINSVLHVFGDQPFEVRGEGRGACEARNNRWLVLFMLGENWHNNHHAFPWSARQGFGWQLDLNYAFIWLLSQVGLAWDLKIPSSAQLESRRRSTGVKAAS